MCLVQLSIGAQTNPCIFILEILPLSMIVIRLYHFYRWVYRQLIGQFTKIIKNIASTNLFVFYIIRTWYDAMQPINILYKCFIFL